MTKKVFVSGCFDLLHSGHVAFFEEAARYGDLYVALGSDRNVFALKNRPTINSQAERLYMVKSLVYVKDAFINQGFGILDFVNELKEIKPDYFIVNEDGHTPDKQALCSDLGIEYLVLKRDPHPGLSARSTTALRSVSSIPLGLPLAGVLFDQPALSSIHAGAVLSLSIYPTPETINMDNHFTGMRGSAEEMWGARLPIERPEKLARMLFAYNNFPGRTGSGNASEAIGIAFSGLTRSNFTGGLWPDQITHIQDEQVLKFLEDTLCMVPMGAAKAEKKLFAPGQYSPEQVKAYSNAVETCWQTILAKDTIAFGKSLGLVNAALAGSAPGSYPDDRKAMEPIVQEILTRNQDNIIGWSEISQDGRPSLLLATNQPVLNTIRISVRRESD